MKSDQLLFELTAPSHEAGFSFEPNPHFALFVNTQRSPKLVSEPYVGGIAAGKNTYVYDAHTYHTKVPPEGIKLLVDYYTRPGDVVLDPFCGSGMTGVAATELGRVALLSDLSPAAAFIAYNLNSPVDATRYLAAVNELLSSSRSLEQELYSTLCRRCGSTLPMLYMVWSYGYLCNACDKEFVLWDVARDERPSVRESKILHEFPCPHCKTVLRKRGLKRTQRYPVQVGYKCCESGLKETCVSPDASDLQRLKEIDGRRIPNHLWYPTDVFPNGINTRQPIAAGITSVDKCYTKRALHAMAHLWHQADSWPDREVRDKLLFTLTSLYQRVTLFSEFRFWGGSGNTANYNVPGIINEQNVFRAFARKANTISWYFREAASIDRRFQVSTQSACRLQQLPDNSIDYVFTDPPFGANINYSEMNFLWESWLQKYTDTKDEAIVNSVQGKGFDEYEAILKNAFCEIGRVLKPHAWLTVIFHNSSHKAWAAIQNALNDAGFEVRGTQTFDKKHGTFKMFVSDNAVGYDLVLHCQKSSFPLIMSVDSPTDRRNNTIAFIRTALEHQPAYVTQYLHVKRSAEFDYRRLYAEWLVMALPNQLVAWDFETFRGFVDEVLREQL